MKVVITAEIGKPPVIMIEDVTPEGAATAFKTIMQMFTPPTVSEKLPDSPKKVTTMKEDS